MAFSNEAKQYARDRANGHCEFPGRTCDNPNTNRVNHITGVFEALLDHKDRRAIRDPKQNAAMLCDLHETMHDAQEAFQIQSLLGERHAFERPHNVVTRIHRRRRR